MEQNLNLAAEIDRIIQNFSLLFHFIKIKFLVLEDCILKFQTAQYVYLQIAMLHLQKKSFATHCFMGNGNMRVNIVNELLNLI